MEQCANNTIFVHDLEVVNGVGQLDVNLKGKKWLVTFAIGQTRYTTIPASYRIEVSP
jgi:hypothetical protein